MSLYEDLIKQKEKIAIIGLGYVGLPLAIALAKHMNVIGFDVNEEKVDLYHQGVDPTNEVGATEIQKTTACLTTDETKLKEAKFHIVAVPTPINQDKTPNLFPVEAASRLIGRNLVKGSIVVFESTVYPGATEEICVPILEEVSGLKNGVDFKVGYSPERINPGDKVHTLEKIVKVVSAQDAQSLAEIAKVYELIIEAGVHLASSIKVAEATKLVENTQRDVNIAFMNEVAMTFNRMNINTNEVIAAMKTKWNALNFYPGLVGGHCIAVDPHYFIYKASKVGHYSEIISSSRKINDEMSAYVADAIVKQLVLAKKVVTDAKIAILGITFKPNCPDIRNSKIIDTIRSLYEYGIKPIIADPIADLKEAKEIYDVELLRIDEVKALDCLVLATPHEMFKKMDMGQIGKLFKDFNCNSQKIIVDVKGALDRLEIEQLGYRYWSL